MKDRQDAIEKFQNLKSNVKFFISNPQTGGMGITLTHLQMLFIIPMILIWSLVNNQKIEHIE